MGMRQLLYHHAPRRRFVLATQVDSGLADESVLRRNNRVRVADFLDNLEGADLTSTMFEGVLRLPPAHSLTVDRHGYRLRRYWAPVVGPELRLPSDTAYVDAFLAVFNQAVACRVRSAGPVGAFLSGGIDSSADVAA